MKNYLQPLVPLSLLILLGAGCFGGDSSSSGSDGAVWRTNDSGATWDQLSSLPSSSGVGSIAGVNITNIEIDPSDTSTYYIGTESNGVFYTNDFGTTWARFEDAEIKSGYIVDVEVDPNSLCTIYVMKSDQLLKSTNCGREWNDVYSETRSNVSLTALELDWYNTDRIWIGTSDGDVTLTEDAGATWDTLYHISGKVSDILVSNSDSRIVMYVTFKDGYRRTTDGGETWTEIEDELSDEFEGADKICGLTQDRLGGTILMRSEYGILRSSDQGESWEHVDLLTSPGEVTVWSAALDPDDADTIYYGTEDIFYTTTSGGDAWQTEDLPSGRVPKTMIVHPEDTQYVLTGFAAVED